MVGGGASIPAEVTPECESQHMLNYFPVTPSVYGDSISIENNVSYEYIIGRNIHQYNNTGFSWSGNYGGLILFL